MRYQAHSHSLLSGVAAPVASKLNFVPRLSSAMLCLVISFLTVGHLSAGVVVNDDFADGSVSRTGSLDLTYYGNVSVISDATLDPSSADSNRVLKAVSNTLVIAPLGQTLTLAAGTTLTLSFDLRLSTATSPSVRIGLLNDNGTAVTQSSNTLTNSTDDYGLYNTIGTAVQSVYESGTNGNLFYGTDRSYGSNTAFAIDTAAHHVVMTYSFSGSTYTLTTTIDDVSYGSYSNSASALANGVNELAITSVGNDVLFDNIVISTVPEPQTCLLLMGSLCLLAGIRRKSVRA